MHKVREELLVAVQVGAVKIYVAAMKALREKERQGETLLNPKVTGKSGQSYREYDCSLARFNALFLGRIFKLYSLKIHKIKEN